MHSLDFIIKKVTIDKCVQKDLKKLDKHICKTVISFIEELQTSDRNIKSYSSCRVLTWEENNIPLFFCVRFKIKKDYRLICEAFPKEQRLNIIVVSHRKDAYLRLKRKGGSIPHIITGPLQADD